MRGRWIRFSGSPFQSTSIRPCGRWPRPARDRALGRRLRIEIAEGEHQTTAGHGALQILAVTEAVALEIAIALGEPLANIGAPVGHRVAGVLQGEDAAPVQLGEYGVQAVTVGNVRPGLLGSGLPSKLGLDGRRETSLRRRHAPARRQSSPGRPLKPDQTQVLYAVEDVVVR